MPSRTERNLCGLFKPSYEGVSPIQSLRRHFDLLVFLANHKTFHAEGRTIGFICSLEEKPSLSAIRSGLADLESRLSIYYESPNFSREVPQHCYFTDHRLDR